ncbi:hypothetical protein [Streptomyces sp. NPDC046985]|uniref:hypothetical protein n=1 Tax=Streptomyces sp. NPDC046985 TaxID=3155377 RepID=UPI0033E20E83
MRRPGWAAVGAEAKEALELLWREGEHLGRREFVDRLRDVIDGDDPLADLVETCEQAEREGERGGVLSVAGRDPAARWWECPSADCDTRVPGTYREPLGLTHCPTHPALALRSAP